jgi:uncharacterized membrane protein
MASAPSLRIGDAEREAAAASLREHFAAGRLTLEEFQHRLGAVFGAKTDGDLSAVTHDLPYVTASPDGLPADSRGGRGGGWRAGARGGSRAGADGAARQRPRAWFAATAGLLAIVLALAVVAMLLPVALFGMALSRSVWFVLALLLFGRRGLLRRLRGWLGVFGRRRPF